MSNLTDIKKGLIIKWNGDPYVVTEAQFLRMQQRKPVMQTRMRNLKNGKMMEYNFKQGETIEEANTEKKKASYLYRDGDKYYFMDETDYEQFFVAQALLGDKIYFLKESLLVNILFFDDAIIGVELPPKVELKVIEAPDGVRGDTASNTTKTVELETGYKLNVPLFIKQDEVVRINTDTGEYVERVSK